MTRRIIKGEPLLLQILSSGIARSVSGTTIPCGDEAAVEYLIAEFGQGRGRPN